MRNDEVSCHPPKVCSYVNSIAYIITICRQFAITPAHVWNLAASLWQHSPCFSLPVKSITRRLGCRSRGSGRSLRVLCLQNHLRGDKDRVRNRPQLIETYGAPGDPPQRGGDSNAHGLWIF